SASATLPRKRSAMAHPGPPPQPLNTRPPAAAPPPPPRHGVQLPKNSCPRGCHKRSIPVSKQHKLVENSQTVTRAIIHHAAPSDCRQSNPPPPAHASQGRC